MSYCNYNIHNKNPYVNENKPKTGEIPDGVNLNAMALPVEPAANGEVFADKLYACMCQRHNPLFAALAGYQCGLFTHVDIVDIEPDDFGAAKAGAPSQFTDKLIAQGYFFSAAFDIADYLL